MKFYIISAILCLLLLSLAGTVIAVEDSLDIPLQDKEGNLNVSVQKIDNESSLISIAALSLIILLLIIAIIALLKRFLLGQKKRKALNEKVSRMDKDEAEFVLENPDQEITISQQSADVDKFLKEDERQIVSILRQREGICSQATLRVVGNFSKANLSRLLSELEQRNILVKEKRGKKNLVILK
ncbi:MAG TPA: hypothetical protein VJI75_02655 [Candidatus Nanoarchaeia archaeon]|nr:hypothetical protein [Candidatus Nanoarchaeia archaeon]